MSSPSVVAKRVPSGGSFAQDARIGEKNEPRRIQSIEVGFSLIRELERAGAKLPLKVLSERAGMPPSKAHLYLVSFARLGLVVQDPLTMRYGLGPYAVQLGLSALRQLSLTDIAREPLEAVQQRFGHHAYLSIWGNQGPVVVMKLDSDLMTPLTIRVGFVFPLLGTATGRVFLAHMPARDTAAIVEREGTVDSVLLDAKDRFVEEALRDGVAVSDGYFFKGFSAISVPVFDHSGAIAAAVSILGVARLVDGDPAGEMVGAVKQAAGAISVALGHGAGTG